MTDRGIVFWVIYDHPTDYPNHWVLRPQTVTATTTAYGEAQLFLSLEGAQAAVPAHSYRVEGPGDDPDPKIHEVWMQ